MESPTRRSVHGLAAFALLLPTLAAAAVGGPSPGIVASSQPDPAVADEAVVGDVHDDDGGEGVGGDAGGGGGVEWRRKLTERHSKRWVDDWDTKVERRRACEIASCNCDEWERAGVDTDAPRPWLQPRWLRELSSDSPAASSSLPMDGSPPGGAYQPMPTDGSSREDILYNNFLKYCGCGEAPGTQITCHGFITHFLDFAKRHREFVAAAKQAYGGGGGGGERPKVLVIRSDWYVLGLGHMAPTAANWILLALVSGRLVFFDNRESKYDWLDYFEAWFGEETPGLDLAFTPAVEAHLQSLGYSEQLDSLGEETFYSEDRPTSSDPVRCDVGHCQSNFWCNKHEMDLLDENEKRHEMTSVEAPGEVNPEVVEPVGDGTDERAGMCTQSMKKKLCAMGTIPMWECEPCMRCVSNHMEFAPWITIKGPGVKPPPVLPLKHEHLFRLRLEFWDAVARLAGTTELLDIIRNNRDRCVQCGIYSLIRPKFTIPSSLEAVTTTTATATATATIVNTHTTTTSQKKTATDPTEDASGGGSGSGHSSRRSSIGQPSETRHAETKSTAKQAKTATTDVAETGAETASRPHPRWMSFFRSPYAAAGSTRGLACLKVRTGYAESKLCFPDATKPTQKCMEGVYATPPCSDAYNNHMAIRLQYDYGDDGGDGKKRFSSVRVAGVRAVALAPGDGVRTGSLQTKAVGIAESVECMRRNLGGTSAEGEEAKQTFTQSRHSAERPWPAGAPPFVHLITDTPALQTYLTTSGGEAAAGGSIFGSGGSKLPRSSSSGSSSALASAASFLASSGFNGTGVTAFSGVGVDLTNAFRGDQDSGDRSKWKVAFDYYLQAWCDETVMLSPSEFYASAMQRSLALNPQANLDTCVALANDYLVLDMPKRKPREFSRVEALEVRKFWKECGVNIEHVQHTLEWGLVFDFGFDVVNEIGVISRIGWDKQGGKYRRPVAADDGSVEAGGWPKSSTSLSLSAALGRKSGGGGDVHVQTVRSGGGGGGEDFHLVEREQTEGTIKDNFGDYTQAATATTLEKKKQKEEKETEEEEEEDHDEAWWFAMATSYAGGIITAWVGYALVQRRRRLRGMGMGHQHQGGGAHSPRFVGGR